MNFAEEIKLIRKKKHEEYMEYIGQVQKKQNMEIVKHKYNELRLNKINIMANLRKKYKHIFDTRERAAIVIQKFIRNKYFKPACINEDEIHLIPPMYRFRIFITSDHINEYNEEDIPENLLIMHRQIYKMTNQQNDRSILFRYCFDIRKLYPIRHNIIEIYDNFYFMQPDDHIRINKLWEKVNNKTNRSIIFYSMFEYHKSLSLDMHNVELSEEEEMEQIKKTIETILDNEESERIITMNSNVPVLQFDFDLSIENINDIQVNKIIEDNDFFDKHS